MDEYLTRTDSTGTANFLTDALGSALLLTDNSGSVLAQYAYEPFGKTTLSGSSTNPYQYTSRENDGIGLDFNRARYYSPTFQRFISEDPLGLNGGDANIYEYVFSDPTSMTDAFGLSGLLFCRGSGHLFLIDESGNTVGVFQAANNASSDSQGPFPDGMFPIVGHNYHQPNADGPFGLYGIFVFNVDGMPAGMGVHSGRRNSPDKRGRTGVNHATHGCIRTTDEAMAVIVNLDETDPLQRIVVDDCSY